MQVHSSFQTVRRVFLLSLGDAAHHGLGSVLEPEELVLLGPTELGFLLFYKTLPASH